MQYIVNGETMSEQEVESLAAKLFVSDEIDTRMVRYNRQALGHGISAAIDMLRGYEDYVIMEAS